MAWWPEGAGGGPGAGFYAFLYMECCSFNDFYDIIIRAAVSILDTAPGFGRRPMPFFPAPTSTTIMTDTRDFHLLHLLELCNSADVAAGSAIKVEKDDLTLAVFHLDDQFYVTDDLCTHGPGSLSEGYIEGDSIVCDFHNGAFDIRTGEVTAPPCMIPLRTYAVHVVDGKVYIDPEQPAFALESSCPKHKAAEN